MYYKLKNKLCFSEEKKLLIRLVRVLLIIFLNNSFSYSQLSCSQQTLIIRSGYDNSTNAFVANQGQDLNWIVVDDDDVNSVEPRPAINHDFDNVYYHVTNPVSPSGYLSPYIPSFPNPANWACVNYTANCSTSNVPCYSWNDVTTLNVDHYSVINYSFCISPNTDLNSVHLSCDFLADDFAKVCVNGIYIGNTELTGRFSLTNFSVTNALFSNIFHTGVNVISVKINNAGGPTYFYFDGALTCSVSNSGSFATLNCCNSIGNITGQKFLDVNKNGIKDIGESGIENWTINLKDGNGNFLASTQTDNSGNYYFLSLLPNSYIIEEVAQIGFYQTFPATASYNVSLGAGQNISNLDFGNATNAFDRCCDLTSLKIFAPKEKYCVGEPVTFKYKGNSCGFTSSISMGDCGSYPFDSNGDKTIVYTYNEPGNYIVEIYSYYEFSENYKIECRKTIPITISDCGENIISSDATVCQGSFNPSPGDYILSFWVKEALPSIANTITFSSGIDVILNGVAGGPVTIPVYANAPSNSKNIIIDGWQKVETVITIPSDASGIDISLKNNLSQYDVYFDDIRFHPFNSSFKSFVYDPLTLRLAAELDERNYATFYEYDEEGQLIRVKKETEKGIKTIKESRTSVAK